MLVNDFALKKWFLRQIEMIFFFYANFFFFSFFLFFYLEIGRETSSLYHIREKREGGREKERDRER